MNNLNILSISEAKKGLKEKKFSALELTKAVISQIDKTDKTINAFVTTTQDQAFQDAKKADDLISQGSNLPLLGIPIAIKDNFCTQGITTTASSNVLKDFVPPYDATVVQKLKEAGMVLIGKTNMDAWAHGSSTETSDFGVTKNPHNTDFLPGGSSGGSAAAVAAEETIGAIGSETAGSIRQPAAWCGVVGLKPTYGRVSRYGVIAMGSSLDSPGPMTKTVEDSALLLEVIAGKDQKDATTSDKPTLPYSKHLEIDLSKITIGIPKQYFPAGIDDVVEKSIKDAIKNLEKLGAHIKEINLFDPKYAVSVYTILQRSEVSSNLARYDGVRYGNGRDDFGEEAKRRIMLGTYTLSAGYYDEYYKKAQKVRTIIIEDFKNAFKNVDVIVGPTSPSLALPLGASHENSMFGEIADMLVEPSSIAGLAGINIPTGKSENNLPIGMQIIGPQFSEELILQVAHQYEMNFPWRKYEL